MNKQLDQMQEIASGIVKGILASMPKADVAFKRTIHLQEGDHTEVLVVGNIHPAYNDGYCIAVLNPRQALEEQLHPEVAYSSAILKELVTGHCEAMVRVSLVGGRVCEGASYSARQSRSAAVPAG